MIKIKMNENIDRNPMYDKEYAVVKTSKYYDPEGLNIDDDDVQGVFSGTYDECKNWLDNFIDEQVGKNCSVDDEGEDFVCLYYPRAIGKVYYRIIKNENVAFPSTEDELILDLFDGDRKEQINAACKLYGRGVVPNYSTASYYVNAMKKKYIDRYNELK